MKAALLAALSLPGCILFLQNDLPEACSGEEPFCDGESLVVCLEETRFFLDCGGCTQANIDAKSCEACEDGDVDPGELCYQPAQNVPVGSNLQAIAAGDLNNDGATDLAVTIFDNDQIGVLRNQGGSFTLQTFGAGDRPISVAISDINGDQTQDIVTAPLADDGDLIDTGATASDVIQVLSNNGSASFSSSKTPTVQDGPISVALSDLNGDTKKDIIIANAHSDSVSVLLNNGGSFAAQRIFPVGDRPFAVAIGDVNNDQAADIVTANDVFGTVSVLLGDGQGDFAAQLVFDAGGLTRAIVLVDLNQDQNLDIAVVNNLNDTIALLPGNGDGTFATFQNIEVGDTPFSIASGDLDNDGDFDLVTANQGSDDISVLLNNGDATFAPQLTFAAHNGARAVALADLNQDGALDIAVANQSSGDVSLIFSSP